MIPTPTIPRAKPAWYRSAPEGMLGTRIDDEPRGAATQHAFEPVMAMAFPLWHAAPVARIGK
jgi:hypothetical protein